MEPRRPADATTVLPTMDEVGHRTQQDHDTGNSRRGLLSRHYPDRVNRGIISPGSNAQRLRGALREFLAELGEEAARAYGKPFLILRRSRGLAVFSRSDCRCTRGFSRPRDARGVLGQTLVAFAQPGRGQTTGHGPSHGAQSDETHLRALERLSAMQRSRVLIEPEVRQYARSILLMWPGVRDWEVDIKMVATGGLEPPTPAL